MDRDTFFRHLRRSRLFTEQQLAECKGLTDSDRARVIARKLVEQGLLTRFQASRILAGKASRLLLGQYRILNLLGQGATGRVFKAVHSSMERVVAIKVIFPDLLTDNNVIELFDREVRAAAQLHHPNIVMAYDANEIKGMRFLVMEYVEGPSLKELVRDQGPLPVNLACELMRQAADALQYAHTRGMVHRDVKPANLLITLLPGPEGEADQAGSQAESSSPVRKLLVKVADFGLARVRGPGGAGGPGTIVTEPEAIYGTVDYMSPEQAENIHSVDIRSDLYSLGCTFYYALTGQLPFPGGTTLQKLLRQAMEEPRPVQELRPEVPAAVADVVRRLMAKDRAQRFQTPAELAEQLAAWSGPGGPAPTGVALKATPPSTAPGEGPEERQAQPTLRGPSPEAPTAASPLPPTGELPPVDAVFMDKFRYWTAVIESILRRRGPLRRIDPEAFRVLQQELVNVCEQQASKGEGPRGQFYQRLADVLRPWLHPRALAQADPEIRYQLLHECREAEREFESWIAPSQPTLMGLVLTQLKTWREQFGV